MLVPRTGAEQRFWSHRGKVAIGKLELQCHLGRTACPGIERDIANESWKKSPGSGPAPGPRHAPAEIRQNVGIGCCLFELASPRSRARLGCSAFALGSAKPRWARKGFGSLRLISGPTSFSSSSCFSNWLLLAETNPIYCRPKISSLIANCFRSKFAFVWKLCPVLLLHSL